MDHVMWDQYIDFVFVNINNITIKFLINIFFRKKKKQVRTKYGYNHHDWEILKGTALKII